MPTYIVKGKFRDGKPYSGQWVGANADEVTNGLRKEGVTIASIGGEKKAAPRPPARRSRPSSSPSSSASSRS